MSQEQLALQIYISRSNISKIENGRLPSSEVLNKLSEIFNISVEEILAGEKRISEKPLQVNTALYKDTIKKNKTIKILILTIIVCVFIFLLYFFINFYNSVKIYTISTNTDLSKNITGLLIKTRETIYFQLLYDFKDKEIDTIEILNKDKIIAQYNTEENTKSGTITISDYYGYEEYFDFKSINSFINQAKLKIKYKNDKMETYNLIFTRAFSNNKILIKPNTKISLKNNNNSTPKSDFYEQFKIAKEIINDNVVPIEINKKIYDVSSTDNILKIDFEKDNINYTLEYINFDTEILNLYYLNEKLNEINIYTYDITSKKCTLNSCDNYTKDLTLLNEILKNISLLK